LLLAQQNLLRQMTAEEKLSLVRGAADPRELGQAGYWPGVPRLGIPPLRFSDGPPGINANRDATALPAPVALAATFDVESARLYGVVMGREASALEQNVVLAPHVNIVRDPLFRRNHTAFSEDPLLAARIGAAEIRGIQSQGVMAQVKHVAGYNGAQNVAIDERTLHEIYLLPFAAAVEAGVASAMCAYNKIDGDWACENDSLQNGILRGELGFKGFITSDWGAAHSAAAIQKGLDLEMPGREIAGRGGPYFTEALKGTAEVDRAVGRILEQMIRFGLLDRKPAGPRPIDIEADAKVVREIAAKGAVLLTNRDGALPLSARDLESLVVIGPTGGQLAAGYLGERGYGFEERLVSPVEALRKTKPNTRIAYERGVDLTGDPLPLASTAKVEPDTDYSWSGTIQIEEEGDYTFLVQPAVGGGAAGDGSISIDGRRAARSGGPGQGNTRKWSGIIPTTDGRDNGMGATMRLTSGSHRIELAANSTGERTLSVRFAWITPRARRAGIEAAVAAARGRTAVVFAWCGAGTIELPENQNELISSVAAAARKTVVVLNTGGPVLMPWKDKAGAILEMWYPGQEGGWATADLLLGRVNPSGRLPVTFPKRLEDTAAYAPGHPERHAVQAAPGTSGTNPNAPLVTYSEGLAVGYRWLEQQGIAPLFAFGHGLSYTRFEYSGLTVKRNGEAVNVTITVRNAGPRRGVELAQLYVGTPRKLAAFERVELDAGASRTVTLRADSRALQYWSTERHQWTQVAGGCSVSVGGLTGVCP
jgi:beta-glucosidase